MRWQDHQYFRTNWQVDRRYLAYRWGGNITGILDPTSEMTRSQVLPAQDHILPHHQWTRYGEGVSPVPVSCSYASGILYYFLEHILCCNFRKNWFTRAFISHLHVVFMFLIPSSAVLSRFSLTVTLVFWVEYLVRFLQQLKASLHNPKIARCYSKLWKNSSAPL